MSTEAWAASVLAVNRLDVFSATWIQTAAGGAVYVYESLPGKHQRQWQHLRVIWHWPVSKAYDLSYRHPMPEASVFTLRGRVGSEAAWALISEKQGTAVRRWRFRSCRATRP